MSHVVAIAGGSGGLGRALVEALKNDGRYKPLVLVRNANPTLQKDIGVSILETDYSNPDSLVQLLEDNQVDTVISAIVTANMDQTPELNLIKAADRSTTTRRFIPSIWSGFDYTPEHAKVSPLAMAKLTLLDAMSTTSLEWTAVYPGIFLDFYAFAVPSHVKKMALAIDIDANVAAIPGSGTYPVVFTHTIDIARYTAALLSLEQWDKKYFLVGDMKTWNEFVAIVEAAKGVKFDVTYDSMEKLKGGEITQLPGHMAVYETYGGEAAKPAFQKMMAQLSVWLAEGQMQYNGPLLNDIFPEIKPVTVHRAFSLDS